MHDEMYDEDDRPVAKPVLNHTRSDNFDVYPLFMYAIRHDDDELPAPGVRFDDFTSWWLVFRQLASNLIQHTSVLDKNGIIRSLRFPLGMTANENHRKMDLASKLTQLKRLVNI